MTTPAPIVLFCDFGLPYTGQMKGCLVRDLGPGAPGHPIIDLFHDVPAHDIEAGAVLLAAHARDFPEGSVFVCVVDPGVGTQARKPGAVKAGGRWFVGPLHGLFEHVLRRFDAGEAFEITWRPDVLSASFHGRDLFSPVAARIALGERAEVLTPVDLKTVRRAEFDDDPATVIYVDGFGNMVTGLRWSSLGEGRTVEVDGQPLPRARTFGEVDSGELFIYENAVGLAEIAANGANAQEITGFFPKTRLKIIEV